MASTTLITFSPQSGAPAAATMKHTGAETPRTPASNVSDRIASKQTPSPGNWKHPRMAEIARRRKASTFDGSNALRIAYNTTAFLGTFVAMPILKSHLPFLLSCVYHLTSFLGQYQIIPLHLIRLLFLYNVYQALHPLWKEPDNLSDIPLTPSQRQLLGLDPGSGKPGTPDTHYITPPKYKRSTPRSQSPAWTQSRPASGSGANNRQSAGNAGISPGGSPFRVQSGKWETSRELATDISGNRRHSGFGYDSIGSANASPGRDQLRDSSGIWVPSTPTPSGRGTGASVGLNSKWLYERGRSSSGGRRSFGGL